MIADVLTFKGFRGWTCGDGAESLTWDAAEAGRPIPDAAELAAWEQEYLAAKNAKQAQEEADMAEAVEAKTIPFLNFLATKTNQQIRNRVQTLAVDQAGIVDVLEKLAIAVAVMARKELR